MVTLLIKFHIFLIGPPVIIFCCCCFVFILDADECNASSPVCDVNAICNNTIGSYRCTCNPGYSGDGRTCKGK